MVGKLGTCGTTPMAKEFASNELLNDAGRGGRMGAEEDQSSCNWSWS